MQLHPPVDHHDGPVLVLERRLLDTINQMVRRARHGRVGPLGAADHPHRHLVVVVTRLEHQVDAGERRRRAGRLVDEAHPEAVAVQVVVRGRPEAGEVLRKWRWWLSVDKVLVVEDLFNFIPYDLS